ncbi:MAG: hypothetical protein L3J45_10200 [Flavobacteriaceae bacterium]|nr:hypothetical protein [Flavobacteriaceae bacterium]
MKNIKRGFILIGLSIIATSCYYDKYQDTPVTPTQVSFATDIQPIFNNNCIMCHNGVIVVSPNLKEGFSYNALMSLPTGSIIPGNSAGSELMDMLNGVSADGLTMPPSGKMAPKNIALFGNWIDQGAINN